MRARGSKLLQRRHIQKSLQSRPMRARGSKHDLRELMAQIPRRALCGRVDRNKQIEHRFTLIEGRALCGRVDRNAKVRV